MGTTMTAASTLFSCDLARPGCVVQGPGAGQGPSGGLAWVRVTGDKACGRYGCQNGFSAGSSPVMHSAATDRTSALGTHRAQTWHPLLARRSHPHLAPCPRGAGTGVGGRVHSHWRTHGRSQLLSRQEHAAQPWSPASQAPPTRLLQPSHPPQDCWPRMELGTHHPGPSPDHLKLHIPSPDARFTD